MRYLSLSANAVRQVIVDKSCRLQVGVTNRAAEEFESPFFHVLPMASDWGDDAGISLNAPKVLVIGLRQGKNAKV